MAQYVNHPPRRVEIDEFVELGQIEKFQNEKMKEEMKKKMIILVGKKENGEWITTKTGKKKLEKAVRQLEELEFSAGNHLKIFIRRNTNDKGTDSMKNVVFQMFQNSKIEINKFLKSFIEDLFGICEYQWIKRDIERAAINCRKINAIIQKVDELNKEFKQGMAEIVEKMEKAELDKRLAHKSCKPSVKERRTPHDKKFNFGNREAEYGAPCRKYGKVPFEEKITRVGREAEINTGKQISEVRKTAMEPIFIEEIWRIRLLSFVKDMMCRIGAGRQVRELVNELGGRDKIKENLKIMIDQFSEHVAENLHDELTDDQRKDNYLKFLEERIQLIGGELEKEMDTFRNMINVYGERLSAQNVEDKCSSCHEKCELFFNFPCTHIMCTTCYPNKLVIEGECLSCKKKFDQRVFFAREEAYWRWTAKMDRSIKLMMEILGENRDNKIILLTAGNCRQPFWEFLQNTLRLPRLPFKAVKADAKNRKASTWAFEENCEILLCSPSTCTDKFDVPEATHLIILDQSALLSAVGKGIYDNAKQKGVMIHHMLAEGTIDEQLRRIVKSTQNAGEPQRNGMTLKVGEVCRMFGIDR